MNPEMEIELANGREIKLTSLQSASEGYGIVGTTKEIYSGMNDAAKIAIFGFGGIGGIFIGKIMGIDIFSLMGIGSIALMAKQVFDMRKGFEKKTAKKLSKHPRINSKLKSLRPVGLFEKPDGESFFGYVAIYENSTIAIIRESRMKSKYFRLSHEIDILHPDKHETRKQLDQWDDSFASSKMLE